MGLFCQINYQYRTRFHRGTRRAYFLPNLDFYDIIVEKITEKIMDQFR
ncbi:hypothetical protein C789_2040 [Microcystis aeruginosa FACHB-905 = DIANCHI905]|uniref:Uncharacterized protein n=1 Tax=Microcystis aeruginosa PCC 7806SL TaxID=1903187 RepID=A0AB33BKG0_MICA7|nr:hypothetical protein BH695_2064 [Microcystis aeruginosa PCC 7806SL]ELS48167.1 hypothetical protein C789_2040 [Microcystis aeruginosa FACHB-905 = DIANCHI905]